MIQKKSVQDRFLHYVTFDTQSKPDSQTFPSTEKQKRLGEELVRELAAMGVADAAMDANGYVTATIPANPIALADKTPVLAFIAHMDTSPDCSGANVRTRLIKNYDGSDIVLNADQQTIMRPLDFASLLDYIGQDLIVTDGSTLLGADDKAGIAEIMTMAQTLLEDASTRHGTIKLAFTPDEEVGQGADRFDVKAFGADFAYTVDGGGVGELEYENFNAAAASVTIRGFNIHPGSAKNKMINAIQIGMEFDRMLPVFEDPAHTEGYEGFHHLMHFSGSVEHTQLEYIIRDHDKALFEKKKERFQKIATYLNDRFGRDTVTLNMKDSYYNMKEQILPHLHLIDIAREAMEELGIVPQIIPVRGGTDGSHLSFMGLPCPNLFTWGHNAHGRFEYISVQSMEKAVSVLVGIAEKSV